jgi:hypothetical protein
MTEEKSVSLVSRGTHSWTDGTQIDVTWTCEFQGSLDGSYRASGVRILVRPAQSPQLESVAIHLLERHAHSGEIASEIRRRLDPVDGGYETVFDWNSTVSIPEQELHVALATAEPGEPTVKLKDPISRRFNFLLSFCG